MDLICHKCGERFEYGDAFHDRAKEIGSTFAAVYKDFIRRGCPAMGDSHSTEPMNPDAQALVSAVYEALGDDGDGAAAELEDAEMMGLI